MFKQLHSEIMNNIDTKYKISIIAKYNYNKYDDGEGFVVFFYDSLHFFLTCVVKLFVTHRICGHPKIAVVN